MISVVVIVTTVILLTVSQYDKCSSDCNYVAKKVIRMVDRFRGHVVFTKLFRIIPQYSIILTYF